MNYTKIYDKIINKAKSRTIDDKTYYEVHHIVPQCLNGTNEENNLVKLTLKEHYICHKLLCEIYPENRSLAYAFWMMTIMTVGAIKHLQNDEYFRKDGEQLRRIKSFLNGERINITSREYEYCKKHFLKLSTGVKRTKEQCNFISEKTKIGMKNPEIIKKCGEKNKGSKHYYNKFTGEHHKWFVGDPDIDLSIYSWGRGPLSKLQKEKLSKTQHKEKTLCRIKNTNYRYTWYKDYIKVIPDCFEDLHVKQKNSLRTLNLKIFNVIGLIKTKGIFIDEYLYLSPHSRRGNFRIIIPSVFEVCYDLILNNATNEELAKRIIENLDKIKELNKKYIYETN